MAIFGISDVPEDTELFNTAAPFGSSTDNANSPTIIPTDYAPPSTNEAHKAEVDPELGEGANNTSSVLESGATEAAPVVSAPVDLLDTTPSKDQSDMHDLD